MKLPEYNELKNRKLNGSLLLIGGAAALLLLMILLYFLIPSGSGAGEQSHHFVGGEATFTNQQRDSVKAPSYDGQTGMNSRYLAKNGEPFRPPPPEKLFGSQRAKKLTRQLKESGNYQRFSTGASRQSSAGSPGGTSRKSKKEKVTQKAKSSDIFVDEGQPGNSQTSARASGKLTNGSGPPGQPKTANHPLPMEPGKTPTAKDILAGYSSPISVTGRNRFSPQGSQPYPRAGENFSHAEGNQRTVSFQTPATPYTILEGTLIPATLLSSINSDLPGDIIAIVNRNVYDSIRQEYLLIPKGTKLIGSYNNKVVISQEKLLMSWQRMIFPDGRSIKLSNLNSYDLQGESGLSGKVNNHFWDILGKSALLSLIGAGVSVATHPSQFRGGFYSRRQSVGQIVSQQIARSFNRVANQVLSRGMNRPPTIHIEKGINFNIFVSGDLSFPEPYEYKTNG